MKPTSKLKRPAAFPPLQIRNVMELRGTTRKGLLIHFTAEQWKAATKGMTDLEPSKKAVAALEAVPAPGRPGDWIIGTRCPPDCTAVMRYRRATKQPRNPRSPVGYTPQPDDFIIPECICEGKPDLPGGAPPGLIRVGCRMVIRFEGQGGGIPRPVITCEPETCRGTCELIARRQPNGRIQLLCDCRG